METTSCISSLATTSIKRAARESTVLCKKGKVEMWDLIFIALTIIFFLIALAYVRGCEKLQ
jgi:hypothetical protein